MIKESLICEWPLLVKLSQTETSHDGVEEKGSLS